MATSYVATYREMQEDFNCECVCGNGKNVDVCMCVNVRAGGRGGMYVVQCIGLD